MSENIKAVPVQAFIVTFFAMLSTFCPTINQGAIIVPHLRLITLITRSALACLAHCWAPAVCLATAHLAPQCLQHKQPYSAWMQHTRNAPILGTQRRLSMCLKSGAAFTYRSMFMLLHNMRAVHLWV